MTQRDADLTPPAAAANLSPAEPPVAAPAADARGSPPEVGGPAGPEPTRFGDWELRGRCIDF